MRSLRDGADPDDVIPDRARQRRSTCWPCSAAATGDRRGRRSTDRPRCSTATAPSSTRRWPPPSTTRTTQLDIRTRGRPTRRSCSLVPPHGPRPPPRRPPAELPDRAEGRRAASGHRRRAASPTSSSPRRATSSDSSWPDRRLPVAAPPADRLARRQGARRSRPQPGAGPQGRRRRARCSACRASTPTAGASPSSSSGWPCSQGPSGVVDGRRSLRHPRRAPASARRCRTTGSRRHDASCRGSLTDVVAAARDELDRRRDAHDAAIDERLAEPRRTVSTAGSDESQPARRSTSSDRRRPERDRYIDERRRRHRPPDRVDADRRASRWSACSPCWSRGSDRR